MPFVSAAGGSGTGTNSVGPHTITQPASLAAGNVVVLVVSWNAAVTVASAPDGFTLKRSFQDGTTGNTNVYWKRLTSSEPTWTLTFSAAGRINHDAVQYSGIVASGDPFEVENGAAQPSTVTTQATPSITTAAAAEIVSYKMVRLTTTTSVFPISTSDGSDVERISEHAVLSATNAITSAFYDSDGTCAAGSHSRTFTTTSHGIGTAWIGALIPASGSTPNSGSATGTWSYTSSAAGQRTPKGSTSGMWSYTSSASGKKTPSGSASGAWSYTSTASGKRVPQGSAAGTWTFTSSATGATPVVDGKSGSASGTWTYTSSAAGAREACGSAVGTWGYVSSATGEAPAVDAPNTGSASGAWSYTSAATGRADHFGSAAGSWGYTSAAVGATARGGAATGTWFYSSEAVGRSSEPAKRAPFVLHRNRVLVHIGAGLYR